MFTLMKIRGAHVELPGECLQIKESRMQPFFKFLI